MSPSVFVGLDLGTSGCRGCAIDEAGRIVGERSTRILPPAARGPRLEQDAEPWWAAACEVLGALTASLPEGTIRAIAVDGTSGTLIATDAAGSPLAPALMYTDARATDDARARPEQHARRARCAPDAVPRRDGHDPIGPGRTTRPAAAPPITPARTQEDGPNLV